MSVYDDDHRALHEAIGHMSMLASPNALGKASRQVRDADPAVAAHLLRWADLHACSLTTLDFEDRRRHWPSLSPFLDDEHDDSPYPWEAMSA